MIKEKKNKKQKKGKLLEQVVASLHSWPNAKVSTNARIPTLLDPTKKREFDVLVETQALGYKISFIIECKNHNVPLDAQFIDAFLGKLKAVGHSPQQALFVTRLGLNKDAAAYAKREGIRTFTVEGLSADGLNSMIIEAVQTTIFYRCKISEFIVFQQNPDQKPDHHLCSLFEESGSYVGTSADLIWFSWYKGHPPMEIGEYTVSININGKYHQLDSNEVKVPLKKITAVLNVDALAISFHGEGNLHLMRSETDKKVEKFSGKVRIPLSAGELPTLNFRTKKELKDYQSQFKGIHFLSSVKLPRIDAMSCYWPPTKQTIEKMEKLVRPYLAGEVKERPIFSAQETEGTQLNSFFSDFDESWQKYFREVIIARKLSLIIE